MNYAELRISLILIRALAVQQAGLLEELRAQLPSSPGGKDELDLCIVINKNISEEASDAGKSQEIIFQERGAKAN